MPLGLPVSCHHLRRLCPSGVAATRLRGFHVTLWWRKSKLESLRKYMNYIGFLALLEPPEVRKLTGFRWLIRRVVTSAGVWIAEPNGVCRPRR